MTSIKQRKSGIELLKIIAMFAIVIYHITQTVVNPSSYFSTEATIAIGYATTDIQVLILTFLNMLGALGNDIFFICSSWFLLESKKNSPTKVMHMLADVWVISFLFLSVFLIGGWFDISGREIIMCLFPNTHSLCWYATCYILFYIIHPVINQIIYHQTQKELLSTNFILLFLYSIINFISSGHFFVSQLIEFIVIYFATAYLKLYMSDFCENTKVNVVTMLIGFLGTSFLLLSVNYLGLYLPIFQNKVCKCGGSLSPFFLLSALSLFNLFKNIHFQSKTINYISSLTLLIYLIHENYLIRTFFRPYIWITTYNRIENHLVILWVLLAALILFTCAVLVSHIYKFFLQNTIYKFSNWLLQKITISYNALLNVLLQKLH